MSQKVAIAVIHGIGAGEPELEQEKRRDPDFLIQLKTSLTKHFKREGLSEEDIENKFEFQPIYWAPVLQVPQNQLWENLKQGGEMNWMGLREFLLSFLSDAIAYQITPDQRHVYDAMHGVFSQAINQLANTAGERAPLCLIAHSLGTVIAENYFYDLQAHWQSEGRDSNFIKTVLRLMNNTPIERGETLSLLYTLGSPIALWSVRYKNFGEPIQFPPLQLATHYPQLQPEWVNFYDKDDIIGFPLKSINENYNQAVTIDKEVNVGGIVDSWNPMSHNHYWKDDDVTRHIAKALVNLWNQVN